MKKFFCSSVIIALLAMVHGNALTYVTGFQRIDNKDQATLWVSNKEGNAFKAYDLPGGGKDMAQGSITKGAFNYVVGFAANTPSTTTAALWVTTLSGEYIRTVDLADKDSEASAILAQGEYLYICGSYENSAVLWKVKESDFSLERFSLTGGSGVAVSLTFLNQNMYIAGIDNQQLTLWVFDTTTNSSSEKQLGSSDLPPQLKATYINHIGNKLYLVSNENTTTPNATLWIIDSQSLAFTKKSLDNNISTCTSYVRVGNRLYIGGLIVSENSPVARVWICSLEGEVINSFQPGDLSGVASVACVGNQLVCAGIFVKRPEFRPGLVATDLQGKLINQVRLEEKFGGATNVYIPVNQSESLLYFSKVKFQKGS